MFGFFSAHHQQPIYLHNSATRTTEKFVPLRAHKVLMYTCGPTVYDHIHIGNLRAYLLPDLLRRLFLYNGYTVKLTINVTDFGHLTDDADAGEDKMMKGMKREGLAITLENMRTFAEPYIASFQNDLAAFGNLPPTDLTRASDYVKQQIALVETLMQKGYAYEISDGVYFDTSKFPKYGVLGNVDLSALKSGARVAANPAKHHPADFALWKKGDLGWKSRWGTGFPGWHIECTAMAFATLGKQIDIHTGGEDLMYTHHNGEIAQAESLTKKPFVNYWLHNAFVTVNEEKLAKSKGNSVRLSDLSERGYSGLDYRYLLLQSHYRSQTNFSYEALESAHQALLRLHRLVYEELAEVRASRPDERYESRFVTALSQDLDTPAALSVLWELVRDTTIAPPRKLATLHTFDSLLALGLSKPIAEGRSALGIVSVDALPQEIQDLMKAREDARRTKDWAKADAARDKIESLGYTLEDTSNGPRITKQ